MSIVHNERVKLLAGALNTLGIAMAVTGAIAPLAGAIYGTIPPMPIWARVLGGLAWLSGSIILHLLAQFVLGRLRSV